LGSGTSLKASAKRPHQGNLSIAYLAQGNPERYPSSPLPRRMAAQAREQSLDRGR
jgi:hypothetical protein